MDKNIHTSPIFKDTPPGEDSSLSPIYYSPEDKTKPKLGTSTPGLHGSRVPKRDLHSTSWADNSKNNASSQNVHKRFCKPENTSPNSGESTNPQYYSNNHHNRDVVVSTASPQQSIPPSISQSHTNK